MEINNHDNHPFPRMPVPGDEERIEMGGQAVIEGVLMRSRTGYAVALRREDDAILVRQIPYKPLSQRYTLLKLPVLRGVVALFEMMALGSRALHWSGEEFEARLKREEEGLAPGNAENPEQQLPSSPAQALRSAGFAGLMALSLSIVIVMMVIAPNLLALAVGKIPFMDAWAAGKGTLGFTEENHPFWFNIVSGLFRGLILFAYVWVIARSKDIRRVFEYHGAEHKAVLAFEEKKEVTVARAQSHDTLHPRCGTTFLAVVVFVSIIVFALIAAGMVAWISGFPDWPFWQRKLLTFALHVLALPLVAGTAFELMKFCARHERNPLCAALLWPGFRFQRLTTRQPSDDQVEVAIVAMLAALAIQEQDTEPHFYVVRGLHDDESAPGYKLNSATPMQEAAG